MSKIKTKTLPSVLDVFLSGAKVGTLTALPGEHAIFAFDEAHLTQNAPPVLSWSFWDPRTRRLRERTRPYKHLPPFFANLLPEEKSPLRELIARRAGINAARDFHLLHLIGEDLPGAVIVRPSDTTEEEPSEVIRSLGAEPAPDAGAGPLKFSLAGVQLKFSVLTSRKGTLTMPAGGQGGDWIVKIAPPRFADLAENEYAMMTLAAAAGIDVPEIRLLPAAHIMGLPKEAYADDAMAFAIRRFDRMVDAEAGVVRRVHIEDFAQVFDRLPADKYKATNYDTMLRFLWIETDEKSVEQFLRRLVFNAAIGNGDAHLKNWSLIYPDGRSPRLAPAYDLVSTIGYVPNETMALNLAHTRSFGEVSEERFVTLARRTGVPERTVLRIVRDEADRIADTWTQHRERLPIAGATRAGIDAHMRKVPLIAARLKALAFGPT